MGLISRVSSRTYRHDQPPKTPKTLSKLKNRFFNSTQQILRRNAPPKTPSLQKSHPFRTERLKSLLKMGFRTFRLRSRQKRSTRTRYNDARKLVKTCDCDPDRELV